MAPCRWCGCAASGTADVVDAIVIATAVRYQAPIVTSDPRDLTPIADSIGVERPPA
jgi:predicted nucleic acid-binding protein